MKISAFDLLQLLPEVERVSSSTTLEDTQRTEILREMLSAVPEPVFCTSATTTRQFVIQTIEGAIHASAEKATPKVPNKKGNGADATTGTEKELLPDPNGDRGGPGVKTPVVHKTPQKRRQTKRST